MKIYHMCGFFDDMEVHVGKLQSKNNMQTLPLRMEGRFSTICTISRMKMIEMQISFFISSYIDPLQQGLSELMTTYLASTRCGQEST